MKKVLFLSILAGFTFASCGDNTKTTQTETEVLTDTVAVVKEREVEIEKTTDVDIDTTDAETVETIEEPSQVIE